MIGRLVSEDEGPVRPSRILDGSSTLATLLISQGPLVVVVFHLTSWVGL